MSIETFLETKVARIWSDWESSSVWDKDGVCVPSDWLPVSNYALALIQTMQYAYDCQIINWDNGEVPFEAEHSIFYQELCIKAKTQVKLELPTWDIR